MTNKRTVSVRLGPEAERRLRKAASLSRQSYGAFLQKAGDEAARGVLLDWATARYRQGAASFSELAEETGLAVEEIMLAAGRRDQHEPLSAFLAASKTVAETEGKPQFLALGQEAVEAIRKDERFLWELKLPGGR